MQPDALIAAGVGARHLFEDEPSGTCDDRPDLKTCLVFLKANDTLVVEKLERLWRSLPYLLSIIPARRLART